MPPIYFDYSPRRVHIEVPPPPPPPPPPKRSDDEPRRSGASTPPSPSQVTTPREAVQAIRAQPLPRMDDLSGLPPHAQDLMYAERVNAYNDQRAAAARDALQRLAPERDDYSSLNPATANAEYHQALTDFNADPDVAELRRIESEATTQRSVLPSDPNESACSNDVSVPNASASAGTAEPEDIGLGLREEPASRDMWLGVNARDHVGGSGDYVSGDFRGSAGSQTSLRTGDSHVSVSSEATLAGNVHSGNTMVATNERVSIETPNVSYESTTHYREDRIHGDTVPVSDPPRRENGGISPDFNVWSASGSRKASVASVSASGEHGSITASAFGAEATGSASAGFGPGTVRAEVAGSASVYAARVQAEVHAGPARAAAEAQVGAQVEGAGEVEFDPLRGDVNASAEASAFAGARAEAELGLDVGPAEATAQGDVGAGIGGDVKAEVGFDDGTFEFGVGAHGYLGVGGGGEVSFEVDVPELAGKVADVGGDVVDLGRTGVDKLSFWN